MLKTTIKSPKFDKYALSLKNGQIWKNIQYKFYVFKFVKS